MPKRKGLKCARSKFATQSAYEECLDEQRAKRNKAAGGPSLDDRFADAERDDDEEADDE
jgi:hypothetical protein